MRPILILLVAVVLASPLHAAGLFCRSCQRSHAVERSREGVRGPVRFSLRNRVRERSRGSFHFRRANREGCASGQCPRR
ncbi:MAG: hypothetical protein AB7G28_26370 [Pirellulales bacterium]